MAHKTSRVRADPARQRVGPLRPVARVICRAPGLFMQGLVELSCGHRVRSNSLVGQRARCGDPTCVEPWAAARREREEGA